MKRTKSGCIKNRTPERLKKSSATWRLDPVKSLESGRRTARMRPKPWRKQLQHDDLTQVPGSGRRHFSETRLSKWRFGGENTRQWKL